MVMGRYSYPPYRTTMRSHLILSLIILDSSLIRDIIPIPRYALGLCTPFVLVRLSLAVSN